VLSIDQFVPFPIVGKPQEIVVGELDAGGCSVHGRLAGHVLIVPNGCEERAGTELLKFRMICQDVLSP